MSFQFIQYFFSLLILLIQITATYGQTVKAYDNYISISNDRSYVIDVINNDQYKGAISLKIISFTSNGQPAFEPKVDGINIKVKYNKTGTNIIEYEICDKDPQTSCSRALLIINITNDKVSAAKDIYQINDLEEQKYKVLENDFYSGSISLKITKNPIFGTAKVSNKTILYQPNHLSFEKDSIYYTIEDGNGNKSSTYVYVYSNDPPPAENSPPEITDIILSIDEDETISFSLNLFNQAYSDKENDPLSKIKFISIAGKGDLLWQNQNIKNGDAFTAEQIQDIKYVPQANYFGTDEIKWHAADPFNFSDAPARILLEIKSVNDAPVANDDNYSISEGDIVELAVMQNDSDPEADPIQITKVVISSTFGEASVVNNKIKFTPAVQFNGQANLSYTISDGNLTASANVIINVAPVFEKPLAKNFSIDVNEDEVYRFYPAKFSENFEDPDDQELTHITFTTLPGKGSLLLNNQPVNLNDKIKLSDVAQLGYKPLKNYYGNDQLKWAAFDANHRSDPASITIHILSINDLPIARDDNGYQVNEDESIIIDILNNDSDVESKFLQIISVAHENISYTITEDNKVEIIPKPDYCGKLNIDYTIEDEDGGTATATIYVDVLCVDDSATISDLSLFVEEDHELFFEEFLFHDATHDPDGDPLEAIIMKSLTQNGVIYLSGEAIQPDTVIAVDQIQYLSFKPDYNWNGTSFFSWKAITGSAESLNQARGNINVNSITDEIIIYDGFSPNGDSMNEGWIIGNIQDYPDNQVKIFNRYNVLVYQQSNYDNEARVWKGETNVTHFNQDHKAPDDIYYYLISLKNGQKIFKGAVILKR